tara:strand:+ start:194 stop:985 length:792 start_codon:yes stop_codon:yes gene_type:complete
MRYYDPLKESAEGELLAIVKQIEKAMGIEKNSCMSMESGGMCKDDDCPTCGKKGVKKQVRNKDKADLDDDGKLSGYEKKRGMAIEAAMSGKKKKIKKADMSEKNKYCMKKFGKKYSECSAEQKAQCDRECGDVKKSDPTSDFLQKYFQEKSGSDVKPMYMEISGETEIPAHGPHYNQLLPYTEDGPKKSITSENYDMPSVYKTGYGVDGSSLHMKLNDGGTGGSMYRDKVEEALATIRKQADVGQLGIIDEIASKIEQIYARL